MESRNQIGRNGVGTWIDIDVSGDPPSGKMLTNIKLS